MEICSHLKLEQKRPKRKSVYSTAKALAGNCGATRAAILHAWRRSSAVGDSQFGAFPACFHKTECGIVMMPDIESGRFPDVHHPNDAAAQTVIIPMISYWRQIS
ncbi:MAG: hypothetical protein AB7W37_17890 [Syntrophobacteraceae bacterium]